MIKKYREKYVGTAVVICDAENLPFKDQTVDLVVCSSFLHHLPTDRAFLMESSRVLKETGVLMGIREPKMAGCDFWFKFHHIARRYRDRNGIKILFKRVLGKCGGWKKIWAYEMTPEEFTIQDVMEIQGATLHPTPTKKHGGINSMRLAGEAEKLYETKKILPFGFVNSFFEFFSLLFQKNCRE